MKDTNIYTEHDLSPLKLYLASYTTIFIPLIMTAVAIYFWEYVTTIDIVLFVVMYILTGLGVTVGFHRHFAHRSFKCAPWLQYTLMILGSMAVQGSPIYWIANHRKHHRFTDKEEDPHTPILENKSWSARASAFIHSHIGWILKGSDVSYDRYAPDILHNPKLYKLSHAFILWVALGFILPGVIAGLWTQTWLGFWMGILWGGFVRTCALQQVTYSINSICHLFGKKTYEQTNESRDNWVFGILALGEGWHNTHHRFPTSARQGLKFWQFDISYSIIYLLSRLGVVWDIKLPKKEAAEATAV
jgi:stearoyl-CoA desaturase (delta-9 desaturase)